MISEFNGTRSSLDSSQLLEKIRTELSTIISNFDGNQKKFFHTYLPDVEASFVEDAEIPFLNLKPKIHKMNALDIEKKKIEQLTFRPVVDQSKWIFKKLSVYLLEILQSLKSQVLSIFDSPISSIFAKSGHEVRLRYENIAEIPTSDCVCMISADLSNAYSEVLLNDLELAVEHLGMITGLSDWKIELIIDICRLILNNNFIECSQGIFELRNCLPMGMSASPVCLDIVGLSSEVKRFAAHQTLPEDIPEAVKELHSKGQLTLNCTPSEYMIYQDDTKAIFHSKEISDL